jgi:hypothetical protein
VRTVGEAVASLEQSLLLGRVPELEVFRTWLLKDAELPELLNVSGPPGVGKTTLLSAFGHEAARLGMCIASADGHSFGATPQGLVTALSGGLSCNVEDLVSRLNSDRSIVLLDTFEELEHLTGFLQQELLPRLETGVKVVIAGRRPLVMAWRRADAWPKIVRLLPLECFSESDSRLYLERRGLERPDVINQVLGATGGNPLALSLAADIVVQFGVRDFAADPQWRLACHSLVRRLLSEVGDDPPLATALEACSVVRVFDEATLAAITGQEDVSRAFDRLCRLSIVKPASNGLMLHDQVRATIAKDLAWRRPHHHQLLRTRALGHLRERLRTSPPADRAWLIGECFFLWGNALIQEMFFGSGPLDGLTVEPPSETDTAMLPDLYERVQAGATLDEDVRLLGDALDYSGTRLRVAKGRDGAPCGFSAVVPVCRESLRFFERHPVHADMLNAFAARDRHEELPPTADRATTHYLLHVVATGDATNAARSALLSDIAAIFGLGAIYICTTREPVFNQMLEACGFQTLAVQGSATGWMLDLRRLGFDSWIEGLVEGRPPQSRPDRARLELELVSALIHWHDRRWLEGNCPSFSAHVSLLERADCTRQTIQEALSSVRAESSQATDNALRALELAYMERGACHKQAMYSLSVSRATFYRLCKRGIKALAEHMLMSPVWSSAGR